MGRSIHSYSEANLLLHSTVTDHLSFLAAWFLATMTIFSALCLSRHRKQSRPKLAPNTTTLEAAAVAGSGTSQELKTSLSLDQYGPKPVFGAEEPRQSPAERSEANVGAQISKTASRRRLSVSLSMKLPDRLSKIRTSRRDEKAKSAGGGDPLWMKTIILGERCKVPTDDEDQDEAIIYDEKGNRHRNYRPRTPRSLPVSRNNSFLSVEAIT